MSTSFLHHALASAILLTASVAGAGPITCSTSDLDGALATECLGYVNGNDNNATLSQLAGATQWHGLSLGDLTQYQDSTTGVGSTTALFDVQQSADDPSRGQLVFLQNLASPFVLTLRGSNAWAAYYLAGGATAGSTIQFDIPGEQQGREFSHASIYTAGTPTPTRSTDLPPPNQSVPEPATAALVLLALGAVGSSRWHARRRLPQA